jgi:hypothetical protein
MDRERSLKKAEELTTDAPLDGPTDDNKPDNEMLYDAEGGLMKPGTSADAAAAAAAGRITVIPDVSTLVSSDVSKGRFSFEASGEVLFVRKADKGKKDKWMRESHSRRSDRCADYKGSISRLGQLGND